MGDRRAGSGSHLVNRSASSSKQDVLGQAGRGDGCVGPWARSVGCCHRHRNELRLVDLEGAPLVHDGRRPARGHILEPISVRPVGQRDHESSVGRHGLHWRFVWSSRRPADVADDRCKCRQAFRLEVNTNRFVASNRRPSHGVEYERRLRPHADHEAHPEFRDGEEHAAERRGDSSPTQSTIIELSGRGRNSLSEGRLCERPCPIPTPRRPRRPVLSNARSLTRLPNDEGRCSVGVYPCPGRPSGSLLGERKLVIVDATTTPNPGRVRSA